MINIREQAKRLGWLLSTLLIIWFVYQSFTKLSIWHSVEWNYDLLLVLIGSILLYCLTTMNGGLVSYYLLRSIGEPKGSTTQVVSIYLIAQLAKYLPGNVAHHIGRLVLSEKLRLKRSRVLLSMLIETIWVIGVVVCLAIYYATHNENDFIEVSSTQATVIVLVLTGVSIFWGPVIFRHWFNRIGSWFLLRQETEPRVNLKLPTLLIVTASLVTYFFNHLILGAIIYLLGAILFDLWASDILTLGSIFAVAWIVGFFTPGSPAGIGVREFVLISLLHPIYGPDASLAITMVLRLTTISGDTVTWVVGYFLWSRSDTKTTTCD